MEGKDGTGGDWIEEGRVVLPSKPCKAVMEVMPIGHHLLSIVIFKSEPM